MSFRIPHFGIDWVGALHPFNPMVSGSRLDAEKIDADTDGKARVRPHSSGARLERSRHRAVRPLE